MTGSTPKGPSRAPVECENHTERVCAAAHRLHLTHVIWARDAISSDATRCYQCHTFAWIVQCQTDDHDSAVAIASGGDGPDTARTPTRSEQPGSSVHRSGLLTVGPPPEPGAPTPHERKQ